MITVAEAVRAVEAREGFIVDPDTGCWLWGGERGPTGHGPFLSFYVAVYGEVPEGFEVHHVCPGARRACVRPSHLDVSPIGASVKTAGEPPVTLDTAATFGRRIRDEREARRQTRAEFARELRVSPETIHSWEQGTRMPSGSRYREIAEVMGWGGPERRWIVTFVQEVVATGATQGEAVRKVWDSIEREGVARRAVVHSARPAN